MRIPALATVLAGAFVWPVMQDVVIPGWLWGVVTAVFGLMVAIIGGLLIMGYQHFRGSIPTKEEFERRLRKEKHDTLEVVRKEYLRPTTDALDKLEARVAQLERRQA